ncbi:Na+/H+ antiporter [Goodfellowiella coeruleoviolacea]|uniref:Monovalent cation:H+ antiporter, CPA1 family n=1 Tax=Goodfellowiella coeruleoviolacea TaxID=334858 RepID=A0AAE3GF32_9PSEU|nr:Na+/H+ antiporter [Goodfellowiella coeruleoviolacea]MCP2166182.1 monovalent cation:H+ antiporter, CPA1 family [Goodfellowiella coeruleoviolacea]
MHIVALLVGSLAVSAVARSRDWPAPLLLVAVGVAVSFVPGVPRIELDPELLLTVVLPPLLYSAALDSSYLSFRASVRPILSLGVGLVLVTAFAVALVASLLMPTLPFAAALVLGAVVAPPDAVSAAAIGRKLNLPRRLMTVLSGESLVNDATALTLYRVGITAVVSAGSSFGLGLRVFALATVVGVVVGLVIGLVVHAVRVRLSDPTMESVLGLVVPFSAYLLAEELSGSGVLAVVAAGLYLGHHSPKAGFSMRLQEQSVWNATDLLLEALVFGLIGLQTRWVIERLPEFGEPTWQLLLVAGAVLVTVIAVRALWVHLARLLPVRMLSSESDARHWPWGSVGVLSWAGMRGVVTLAAATGIPFETESGAPFPARGPIQFFAVVVTIGTLLLQGTTLPWLIRVLHVADPHEAERDQRAEVAARRATAKAALARLDQVLAKHSAHVPEQAAKHIAAQLHELVELNARAAVDRLELDPDDPKRRKHRAFRRMRQELLAAQRAALIDERDSGRLDDEVMRKVLHELDLTEAAVSGTGQRRL